LPTKIFAAGAAPHFVGAGDFTGDGRIDLIVINNTATASLTLLRGTGTGRFRAPTSFDAGLHPTVVAVADYNGDGHLDITALGCPYQCNTLNVVLANGQGGFLPPVLYVIGNGPTNLLATDLNNDSIPDLAAIADGKLQVLLGNGNGTFQPKVSYDFNVYGARGLLATDIDRDGELDLVVSGYGTPSLSVLKGAGDGTFSAPLSISIGTFGSSSVAGDFNGDGWIDLAFDRNIYQSGVAVAINDGDWGPAPVPPPVAGPFVDVSAETSGVQESVARGQGKPSSALDAPAWRPVRAKTLERLSARSARTPANVNQPLHWLFSAHVDLELR
jgi:hypothetical protein